MAEQKAPVEPEILAVSAMGGLWFDTALAQLKFAGRCCQQVAGCCRRHSVVEPLPLEDLIKVLAASPNK